MELLKGAGVRLLRLTHLYVILLLLCYRNRIAISLLLCPFCVTARDTQVANKSWTPEMEVTYTSYYRGAAYQCTGRWLGCEVFQSHVQYIHSSKLVNSAERHIQSTDNICYILSMIVVQFGENDKEKKTGHFTRKSSSGKADIKAGSMAWRKSKPWVAHL